MIEMEVLQFHVLLKSIGTKGTYFKGNFLNCIIIIITTVGRQSNYYFIIF